MKTCEDCAQRIERVCLTHLKHVMPVFVACVYHKKKLEPRYYEKRLVVIGAQK